MATADTEPLTWKKGSRCAANGTCVEIAALKTRQSIAARDAKYGDASPVLMFTPTEWRAFTERVKTGTHDLNQ